MSNPYAALASFAFNAIGAAVASRSRARQIEAQGRMVNLQEALTYGQITNAELDSADDAGAAATDRMREAARALSMARVLAAEGAGSIQARTRNIETAKAEDLNRIDTNYRRARFSFLQERENTRMNAQFERDALRNAGRANRMQFYTEFLSSAAQSGLSYYSQRQQLRREQRSRTGGGQ